MTNRRGDRENGGKVSEKMMERVNHRAWYSNRQETIGRRVRDILPDRLDRFCYQHVRVKKPPASLGPKWFMKGHQEVKGLTLKAHGDKARNDTRLEVGKKVVNKATEY